MNEKTLSIIIKAQDRASKVIADVGSTTARVGRQIIKATAIAGAAATAAFGAMGIAAVKSAGEYEQSRIAFETMLGSADKAQKLMQEIAKFAKETPFELPEVVSGTKQLLAFGYAQKDLLPTMRKIGDLASGLGVPVGQLTNVFGQVKVAGRLMGQDLLQFTNAGVPMIEALSKTMKVSQSDVKDLVSEGKVGFKDVTKALDYLTGSGSKFGGMMDKQSKTFNGVVSNLQDGFGQILRSAVGMDTAGNIVKGSLFDRIKQGAEAVMPLLDDFGTKVGPGMQSILKTLDVYMSNLSNTFKAAWPAIQSFAIAAGNILIPILTSLWNTIKTQLLPALFDLWQKVILPLLPVIGVLFVAALGTVGVALNVASGVIAATIVVITTLGTIVRSVITNIVQFFAWLWQSIKAAIDKIISFIQSLLNKVSGIAGSIKTAVSGIKDILVAPFRSAYEAIKGIVQSIIDAVSAVNNAADNALKKYEKKTGNNNLLLNAARGGKVSELYATGGFTGRGGKYDVAGIVHKGEYVVPQEQVDQSTGKPNIGNTTNFNMYGSVNLQSGNAVDRWFERLNAQKEMGTLGVGV